VNINSTLCKGVLRHWTLEKEKTLTVRKIVKVLKLEVRREKKKRVCVEETKMKYL